MRIWQQKNERPPARTHILGAWYFVAGFFSALFTIIAFPFRIVSSILYIALKISFDLCVDIGEIFSTLFRYIFQTTFTIVSAPFQILSRGIHLLLLKKRNKEISNFTTEKIQPYFYTAPKKKGIFDIFKKDISVLGVLDKPLASPRSWFTKRNSSPYQKGNIFHFHTHEFPKFRAGHHFTWNERRSLISHTIISFVSAIRDITSSLGSSISEDARSVFFALKNVLFFRVDIPWPTFPKLSLPKFPSALTKTYSLPVVKLPKFVLPRIITSFFDTLLTPVKLPTLKFPTLRLPSLSFPWKRESSKIRHYPNSWIPNQVWNDIQKLSLPKISLPKFSLPQFKFPIFSLPKFVLPKFTLPSLSFPWRLPIYSRVKRLIINRSPLGRESSKPKHFSKIWIRPREDGDQVGDENTQQASSAIPDSSYWKHVFEHKEKLAVQTTAPEESPFTHLKRIFNLYFQKSGEQQKGQPSRFFFFKKEQTTQILLLLLVVGTVGVFFVTFASTTNRTKPITYQGRLLDTNYVPVADGNYSMKFRIYDAATNGNCKWATGTDGTMATNCTTPGALTVSVARGLFSVDLGDNTTGNQWFPYDFSDANIYLETIVGSETLSPRRRLTAVPYALNSEELGGIAASGFAQLTGATFTGNVTTTALISSGAVSPSTNDGAALGVSGTAWSDLFLASGGVINFNAGDVTLTHSTNILALAGATEITVTQAIATSGNPMALVITGAAHTGLTAATEDVGLYLNFNSTKTWAAGAGPLVNQREINISAPTYAGDSGGALTMTNAATFYIEAAPTAGAYMTISNAYSLWIDSGNARFDGNVGIGATAPNGKLEVEGGVDSAPTSTGNNVADFNFRYSPTGTNLTLDFGGYATTTPYNWIQSRNLADYSSSYALTLNPNGGNVGIGTTAPSYPLQVYSTATSPQGVFSGKGLIDTNTTSGAIEIGTGNNLALHYENATGYSYIDSKWDSASAQINFRLRTLGTAVNAVTILGSGNVGIGITSPRTSLDIFEDTRATTQNDSANLIIAGNNTAGATGAYLELGFNTYNDSRKNLAVIGFTNTDSANYSKGDLYFSTRSVTTDTVSTERMRIDSSGNVVIGATSASALFQVAQPTTGVGTVSTTASGNTIDGTGTQFTNTFKVGDTFTVSGESAKTISAIASSTNMTITGTWTNTTTTATYTLTGGTRFSVLGNGNVGIGTTAPTSMLELAKSSAPSTITVANNYLHIGKSENAASSYRLIGFGYHDADDVYFPAYIGYQEINNGGSTNGDLIFGTRDGDTSPTDTQPTEKMRIKHTTGNVGIGTTAPSTILHARKDANDTLQSILTIENRGTASVSSVTGAFLNFDGRTTTGAQATYAKIGHSVIDDTNGAHDGNLRFYTAKDATLTEYMRINNNGWVGIGTTTPTTMLTVGTATTNTGDITVYGTGTTCTIGNSTGATNCSSDIRLKKNVTNLDNELDNIMALRPVTFNWKDPNRDKTINVGLIAQEVQALYPSMVHTVYNDYLGIDYAALVVPTIKALQELNTKVTDTFSGISVAKKFSAPIITINKDGNVGIGTRAPHSTLQIGIPGDDTYEYLQLDGKTGAPPNTDCDTPSEAGRMFADIQNNLLYVCNGSTWKKATLN